jgi:hypothetical protein
MVVQCQPATSRHAFPHCSHARMILQMKVKLVLQRVSAQPQAPSYSSVKLATAHSSGALKLLGSGSVPEGPTKVPQWL